ncbi:MAG: DUF134 domain-containing protein [Clostridia bacterium]|nr:DUF134 domain-containing protein [Clostridia bacterium]
MVRTKLCRQVEFSPQISYFKPQGVPFRDLKVLELGLDELEAYRLRFLVKLDQQRAAQRMNISTSTYQRILNSAHIKIADGLINGKAIRILK